MRISLGIIALAGLLCAGSTLRADKAPSLSHPIAADILSAPDSYLNRHVEIYGVVVAVKQDGSFMLQDVSQMPLRVIAPPRARVSDGDQLMVRGRIETLAGEFVIVAAEAWETQVSGRGGCC